MRTNKLTLLLALLSVLALAAPAFAFNYGGGSDATVTGHNIVACAPSTQPAMGNIDRTFEGGGSNALAEHLPNIAKTITPDHSGLDKVAGAGSNALSGNVSLLACSAPGQEGGMLNNTL